jgi:hypothetical protein
LTALDCLIESIVFNQSDGAASDTPEADTGETAGERDCAG